MRSAVRDDIKSVWMLPSPEQHVEGLYSQQKYNEILEFVQRACDQNYRKAVLFDVAAAAAQALGHAQEAERYWKAMLALKPDDATAFLNLARLYQAQGRFDDANTHYASALACCSDKASAHNDYAGLFYAQRRYDEAEVHFQKALALQPDRPEVYNNLGVLYKALRRFLTTRQFS